MAVEAGAELLGGDPVVVASRRVPVRAFGGKVMLGDPHGSPDVLTIDGPAVEVWRLIQDPIRLFELERLVAEALQQPEGEVAGPVRDLLARLAAHAQVDLS